MPTPKRRSFLIKQKQKRVKKRNALLNLSPSEARRIHHFIEIGQWEKEKERAVVRSHPRGYDHRSIYQVQEVHERDFVSITRKLLQRFPKGEINVLDEGAGQSTFHEDLSKLVGDDRVKVYRSDIRYLIPTSYTKPVPPEKLVETFGKNHFHLIVSTFGGTTYSKINSEKAIANIATVLKTGGIASIATSRNDDYVNGRQVSLADLTRIIKRFPELKITEEKKRGKTVIITLVKY